MWFCPGSEVPTPADCDSNNSLCGWIFVSRLATPEAFKAANGNTRHMVEFLPNVSGGKNKFEIIDKCIQIKSIL